MPAPNIFQYVSILSEPRRSLVHLFDSKLLWHRPGFFVVIPNLLGSKLNTLGDVALEARVARFQELLLVVIGLGDYVDCALDSIGL
jgi:hypothetical protein